MGTLANSEDPDEMRNAAVCGISSASTLFSQTKSSFEKEMQSPLKILTCDPSV